MKLAVELYGTRVGYIAGRDSRTVDFVPRPEAIDVFGANSRVLSVAVPLVSAPARQHASRRRNWFEELLPEGDQLDFMLAQRGLRRGDTLGFLARYGRDIAGAVQIWDVDDPTEPRTPSLEPVDDAGIRRLLEDPLGSPLANDAVYGKSSLAGVQPKIVLARVEGQWGRVLGGYPSTHILKPQIEATPTVIYDEEYGSRIARRLGLLDFATDVVSFDGLPALVIERFDRQDGQRVHQEDFSQALGAGGNQKYQELGGVVSLTRVADLLNRTARTRDLRTLARMVVAGVAIGNLDMHSKNIGLLHPQSGSIDLAPAYDFVPAVHQGALDGRLALAVNRKYVHRTITLADLVAEISGWGVRRAESLVEETLEEIRSAVDDEEPLRGAHEGLRDDILGFTVNLLEGRRIGDA